MERCDLSGIFSLSGIPAPTKRRVFFSFHYKDVFRVNVVRKSGEFAQSSSDSGRHIEGYYDKSLWEKKRTESDEALRKMIRDGVHNTSAVCVLIGSATWQRPWVRYEIARSVIDGKGLLGVNINSIKHHETGEVNKLGENPCRYRGVAARQNGSYYLCERRSVSGKYKWEWYGKHTTPIEVPKYMKKPRQGEPLRLSEFVRLYDWKNNGHANIGAWIDLAAQEAGR